MSPRATPPGPKPRPFGGVRPQSGWWQAYYPGPDGHRVHETTHFPSEDAARTWLDDLARERARGSWHDPAAAHQRFDAFATTWVVTHDMASTTRELYAGYLDNHITPAFGLVELGRISPPMVRQWFADMAAKNVPTARARSYSLLREILNVAVADGAIVANPCRIKGAGDVRHKEKATPDLDEGRRIAARMPHQYRLLIAVATTLRYGELVALRRSDIDLRRMTVLVDRQWYRGKFRATKRAASDRTVFLPKDLRGLIDAHLAAHVHPGPDALLFTTRNDCPPPNNWMNELVGRAAADIGRDDLTFHSLRHAGGTLAAQTGATTRELMRRMGQSTPRAAMRYQHAADARDEAIADALTRGARGGARSMPLNPRDRKGSSGGSRADRSAG